MGLSILDSSEKVPHFWIKFCTLSFGVAFFTSVEIHFRSHSLNSKIVYQLRVTDLVPGALCCGGVLKCLVL